MKIEENIVYNEDGSVRCTLILSEEQKKALLQFALNFLVSAGIATQYAIMLPDEEDDSTERKYDA